MRSVSVVRVISMLAVMFAMLFSLSSTTMAKPADNGGPGNSGAAKLCQDGNWMYLARSEQPMVPFANQDECVSYGAQGGTLVDLEMVPEGIFIPAGSTVTFSGHLNGCNALEGSWSGSDGSGGSFGSFEETYNADCGSTIVISDVVFFEEDTLLTFTLTDNSCGVSYTQDSNHGSWSATPTGYQVDIADAGTYCEGQFVERIPAPGTGHLSVTVDVSP